MNRAWLAFVAVPLLSAAFWWGPNARIRLRERGERDGLHRLGVALAQYMGDHDGQYPAFSNEELLRDPHADPLASYARDASWLRSTGTRLPYEFRFVQSLRIRNPRDPMVATVSRRRLVPDSRQVVAAARYEDDWQFGWTRYSRPTRVGSPLEGHAYLLWEDGHVGTADLAGAWYVLFDGATNRWGKPGPAVEPDWSGHPWSNRPWTIYPGEPWPPRTTTLPDRR